MQKHHVQLSAVIITKNEEKNIVRCLDSLLGIADDVLVVDSFSTDSTEALVRNHPLKPRFIQNPFEGHIQQKQFALEHAFYDHIVSLDADEALDATLRASVLAVKQQWTHDGYLMNRLTSYCGQWIRHGGWYPDRKIRVFDRRQGFWTGDNPHDYVQMKPEATVGYLKGDILHYTYYSITEHIAQANRFTDISVQVMLKAGRKPSWFKLVFSPLFKFVRDYIIRMGFLDGLNGLIIASVSAQAAFLKYAKHIIAIRQARNSSHSS